MRRLKFTISYDGTEYHGWQVQPGLSTIQGTLESVLSEIENKEGIYESIKKFLGKGK